MGDKSPKNREQKKKKADAKVSAPKMKTVVGQVELVKKVKKYK